MLGKCTQITSRLFQISHQTRLACRYITSSSQGPRTRPGYRVSFFYEGRFLLLLFPSGCIYMAWKQMEKKEKIEAEIKRMKPLLDVPPVPLPENLSELQNMELRSVTVRGHFDYTNEVYIGPKSDTPERGFGTRIAGQKVSGVHVITPFKLADRDLTILVNRGWYQSDQLADEEARVKGQVHGEQELTGVVRLEQHVPGGVWRYLTDVNKSMHQHGCDVYVYRNLRVLSERCGTAAVFLDAKMQRPTPYAPKPIQPKIELSSSQCIQDVFVWMMLAATSTFYWFRLYRMPSRPSKVHDFLNRQDVKFGPKS